LKPSDVADEPQEVSSADITDYEWAEKMVEEARGLREVTYDKIARQIEGGAKLPPRLKLNHKLRRIESRPQRMEARHRTKAS
jgi:hypothetical protein